MDSSPSSLSADHFSSLPRPPKVVVGMSGGVDSSVSALLLKQQGYEVVGLFMKNWDEKDLDGTCSSAQDYEDVVKVCEKLEIPYYSINFAEEYWNNVFSHFLQEYQKGYTPNPDILCNREIKFQVFYHKALLMGADYIATGHYCQKRFNPLSQRFELTKGADPQKDQSYFLYTMKEDVLQRVLFPIGHLLKRDVRQLARQYDLATFNKKDSTGICFIGEKNFPQFLARYLRPSLGPFCTLSGEVVGQHQGFQFYTLGQRKGLGLGGAGEPWFVVGKNAAKNVVYVERGQDHPALYADELVANEISWVDGEDLLSFPLTCKAKIRYRQADQDCTVEKVIGPEGEEELRVLFKQPQRAIAPRQSVVFYQDDRCLGGAMIKNSGPSYWERGLSLNSNLRQGCPELANT